MIQPADPTDYVFVPLHVELYADLVRRSGDADVSGYVHHSIESFLERTEGDAGIWSAEYIAKLAEKEDEAFWEKFGDPTRGFQWQTVFLPNGTRIRMTYGGNDSYAEIRHARFCYEDEMISPSRFASRVANNTRRNAWRDLYIKFPGEAAWRHADSLRRVKPLRLSDF